MVNLIYIYLSVTTQCCPTCRFSFLVRTLSIRTNSSASMSSQPNSNWNSISKAAREVIKSRNCSANSKMYASKYDTFDEDRRGSLPLQTLNIAKRTLSALSTKLNVTLFICAHTTSFATLQTFWIFSPASHVIVWAW